MNRQVTDLLSGSNPVAQGQCHEIHHASHQPSQHVHVSAQKWPNKR